MLVAVETGHLGSSPDLFVYGIRVREDLRNRGIAHKLVDKAVAVAEDSGCRNVWGSMERGEHLQEDSPLAATRSEEHTSELQSRFDIVCRLLLEKKKILKRKYINMLM